MEIQTMPTRKRKHGFLPGRDSDEVENAPVWVALGFKHELLARGDDSRWFDPEMRPWVSGGQGESPAPGVPSTVSPNYRGHGAIGAFSGGGEMDHE